MKKTPTKLIKFIDLFCGGGGTTEGARQAFEELGYTAEMTGINHWEVAIATSKKNHPQSNLLCMNLDQLNPRNYFRDQVGKINLMWASPECTHHSNARGGKPVNDQSRSTAQCVVRFAEALLPQVILIENVPEFMSWSPLIRKLVWQKKTDGTRKQVWDFVPDPKRKGELFNAWKNMLKAIGYRVEHRVLCCADYGDPTTRERLIIYCVRGKRKIIWPEPTHARDPDPSDMFNKLERWRPVKQCINFANLGHSIFDRKAIGKKDLVPKTMNRIIAGVERYPMQPFVIGQQSGAAPRSINDPAPTVATAGAIAMVTQYICHLRGTGTVKSIDEPANTVTAGSSHLGLTNVFLTHHRGKSITADPDNPSPSITADGPHLGLTSAFLTPNFSERDGQPPRTHSLEEPAPTVTSHGAGGLTTTFLLETNHGNGPGGDKGNQRRTRSVDEPINTVTGSKGHALCQSHILAIDHKGGNGQQIRSMDEPLTTVTTKQRHGKVDTILVPLTIGELTPEIIAEARKCVLGFLVKYYGKETTSHSIEEPIGTVTSKERFAICRPILEVRGRQFVLDIFFRMLDDHELQLCQGFPETYQFTGTKKQIIRQIGNAVPIRTARSLVRSALTQKP